MAVPYLLSFGWGQRYKIKNASHRKWYYSRIKVPKAIAGMGMLAKAPARPTDSALGRLWITNRKHTHQPIGHFVGKLHVSDSPPTKCSDRREESL
jgi:hypothetical protein